MFSYITKSIIPIIVLIIITYGMIKGRKVYDWFIEGAKEGLKVCLNIFPYLLAMIIAVQIFREANLLDMLNNAVSPLCKLIDLPKEVVPLVLIKPLSGSGAMGIFTDILKNYGADTQIGLVASVIMGTTETIFYTMSVYYMTARVTKTRYTLSGALLATLAGVIASMVLAGYII